MATSLGFGPLAKSAPELRPSSPDERKSVLEAHEILNAHLEELNTLIDRLAERISPVLNLSDNRPPSDVKLVGSCQVADVVVAAIGKANLAREKVDMIVASVRI